jgi:membrane-associated protease RseP (regulator of RpoE activity)
VATLSDKTNNEPDWGGFDREQWDLNTFQMDERSKDACLGVYSSGEEQGAQVTEFTSASAAEDAGMQIGDVITAVNGTAVKNHDELWNEIAKYKPNEVVRVAYLRNDQPLQADATLKACDTQNKITIRAQDDAGDEELSRMYIWDWTDANQERLRTSHVITIQRAGEGDTPTEPLIGNTPIPADRRLEVRKFQAFPNPSGGPITISFEARPVPTIVTIFDPAGRQLFREELNSFSGAYSQQFDLSAYAKSNVIVQVQQADKIFHESLVLQ